jgi:hypothetical protein
VSALDTLERQLRDSARRRRRPSWQRRLVPAVIALAAVAALLVLLPPRPDSPNPSDERAATPSPAPTNGPHDPARLYPLPPASHRPVPRDQLAAFAILRRPPTAADRSQAVRSLLRLVPASEVRGVHMDAVRVLGKRGNRLTLLVPMERTSIPVMRDGLCVLTALENGSGMTCGTLADIRKHGRVGFTVPPLGLVPDGVASVKVRVRGGHTITAPVRNNFYVLDDGEIPIRPPVWLDVNGREIPKR